MISLVSFHAYSINPIQPSLRRMGGGGGGYKMFHLGREDPVWGFKH